MLSFVNSLPKPNYPSYGELSRTVLFPIALGSVTTASIIVLNILSKPSSTPPSIMTKTVMRNTILTTGILTTSALIVTPFFFGSDALRVTAAAAGTGAFAGLFLSGINYLDD